MWDSLFLTQHAAHELLHLILIINYDKNRPGMDKHQAQQQTNF